MRTYTVGINQTQPGPQWECRIASDCIDIYDQPLQRVEFWTPQQKGIKEETTVYLGKVCPAP